MNYKHIISKVYRNCKLFGYYRIAVKNFPRNFTYDVIFPAFSWLIIREENFLAQRRLSKKNKNLISAEQAV